MAMDIPLYYQIPPIILLLYIFTAWTTSTIYPTLTSSKIVFLIAHPDDEAMFFAPTLQHLAHPSNNNLVLVLCLSSGDADGLGHVRKGELVRSARMLGVTRDEHVVVVEDGRLPDSMTAEWDERVVAGILARYFAPASLETEGGAESKGSVKARGKAKGVGATGPKADIDAIVTFDEGGVSGHPNHVALLKGAKAFVRQVMRGYEGWEVPVKVYALRTTGLVRKYAGFLDAMWTILTCLFRKKEGGRWPTPLVVVNGPLDVRRGQRAMTTAHQSQMRWFRWGWIGLSRYMYVNDLTKVKVV